MEQYFADLLRGERQDTDRVECYTKRLMECLKGHGSEELPYIGLCVKMALSPTADNTRLLERLTDSGCRNREEQIMSRLLYNLTEDRYERWDGNGTPYGKQGTDISLEARILAASMLCADADPTMTEEEWKRMIRDEKCRWIDPEIADHIISNPCIFRNFSAKTISNNKKK